MRKLVIYHLFLETDSQCTMHVICNTYENCMLRHSNNLSVISKLEILKLERIIT